MQLPILNLLCENNINGQCSKLHVKCLEIRWFGGVPHGKCRIRDGDAYRQMKIHTKPNKEAD